LTASWLKDWSWSLPSVHSDSRETRVQEHLTFQMSLSPTP